MYVLRKEKGAALRVSWSVSRQPMPPGQGGPDAQYATSGGAAPAGIRRRLHAADLPTLCHPAAGRHPDHGAADRDQPAADGGPSGPRPCVQLSPGLLSATLVSRFYPDANLYAAPPVRGRRTGRPRKKGAKQPSPAQVVKRSDRFRLTVAWYGGGQRRVEIVSGIGHWYKNGEGLVPVRWVFVHDCTGTHRDEYFFTTDTAMMPRAVIETYTGRWSIETTFQEMRAYPGLETTRGWSEATVLRAAPCLFGLFSVVAALYAELPARRTERIGILWPGKTDRTFSDAMMAVRRWLWFEWAFATPEHYNPFAKLPRPVRTVLLYALAPAA